MFVFGMDAMANLVKIAKDITLEKWQKLETEPKYEVKTRERKRPKNVKEQVVKRRKFKNIQTESEYIAEFSYRPGKCEKCYRMVVIKKNHKSDKERTEAFR